MRCSATHRHGASRRARSLHPFMNTPTSLASGSTPERATILALIDQLQASSSKPTGEVTAYVCAVLYGYIAHSQGSEFFILYCGVLAVFFLFRSASERRTRQQVDLLVQLARELEKQRFSKAGTRS